MSLLRNNSSSSSNKGRIMSSFQTNRIYSLNKGNRIFNRIKYDPNLRLANNNCHSSLWALLQVCRLTFSNGSLLSTISHHNSCFKWLNNNSSSSSSNSNSNSNSSKISIRCRRNVSSSSSSRYNSNVSSNSNSSFRINL